MRHYDDIIETSEKKAVIDRALETRTTLKEFSDIYIEYILSIYDGNKVRAARHLGVDRRTLQRFETRKREQVVRYRQTG